MPQYRQITSSMSQLGVLIFDWIAAGAIGFSSIFMLDLFVPSPLENDVPDRAGGMITILALHVYFVSTMPFLNGRTLGMLLFKKRVVWREREMPILLTTARACIYIIISLVTVYPILRNLLAGKKGPYDSAFQVFMVDEN
ncbi:hypothetical protein [Kordiimonas sp.]|uniref:hypothetical protein n=1 Tax=Kordiimonas sp. TaxID=1970157 RepID=UPI003A93EF61